MTLDPLTAISPLDGRYANKLPALRRLFSEYGLMRYRLLVEIRWLQMLSQVPAIQEVPALSDQAKQQLEAIFLHFSLADAEHIKAIEAKTNHDIKALEYFLKEAIHANAELRRVSEFIHFACTSEDINNLAYALILKDAREQVLLPQMQQLHDTLSLMAHQYAAIPM